MAPQDGVPITFKGKATGRQARKGQQLRLQRHLLALCRMELGKLPLPLQAQLHKSQGVGIAAADLQALSGEHPLLDEWHNTPPRSMGCPAKQSASVVVVLSSGIPALN